MKKDMTNKEFYDTLLKYEKQGLIAFMPKSMDDGFFKIRIGTKIIALSTRIYGFGDAMIEKIKEGSFHTQKTLENSLGKSSSYVNARVEAGEYVRFYRGKGLKFYIKKDW